MMMARSAIFVSLALVAGCSSDPPADGASACAPDSTGGDGAATAAEVRAWVLAYQAAHPGRTGDINALTSAQVADDAEAARLLRLCGADQRAVIPLLAWEYGGDDHAWIAPASSALVYCDRVPIAPDSDHWSYDAAADHVIADVSVLFPDDNPCRDRVGADQVAGCIGDPSNFELLVDIASYHDGACTGLALAEASTELRLVLADGTTIHLHTD